MISEAEREKVLIAKAIVSSPALLLISFHGSTFNAEEQTEIIQNIQLKENRFGFEPEITAKIANIRNIRIYEVGISYYGRTYAEGKKIGWRDGFRALYCIAKYGLLKNN